jgi:hypothetical protein
MRTQIAAIAVASLLIFAGCSAGGDGGATTTPAPETTTVPGDTTTAPDDGPIYESPLDAATVAQNHEAAVRDAGTFTLESTSNQSQGDQSFSVTSSIAADRSTGEYRSEQNASSRLVETYGYGNGTAYQRLEFSGETQYVVPRQTPNASQLATGDIRSFVNAFEFEHVGSESVDGTPTDVYEASGFESLNQSAPGFGDLDEENVTSIDARVYVTDDGLVKQFEYGLTVDTEQGDASIAVQQRYVGVGSTTVEAPPWLDEARENTSQ